MRKLICLLAILLLINIFTCSTLPAETYKNKTFREEFSSNKLSPAIWSIPTFSLYNFIATPDMVSNSLGVNYLRLGLPKSNMYPTGFINTKEYFYYGSYSARIKFSGSSGAVASFFICTEISKIFTDGMHDEIDFELITAMPRSILLTTWRAATKAEGNKQSPYHNSYLWEDQSFDAREWHVYRFDWFADKVVFYVDEKKVWTSTLAVPQKPMQMALHLFTYSRWKEVQFPPKGEVVQMTDWVEYRSLDNK